MKFTSNIAEDIARIRNRLEQIAEADGYSYPENTPDRFKNDPDAQVDKYGISRRANDTYPAEVIQRLRPLFAQLTAAKETITANPKWNDSDGKPMSFNFGLSNRDEAISNNIYHEHGQAELNKFKAALKQYDQIADQIEEIQAEVDPDIKQMRDIMKKYK